MVEHRQREEEGGKLLDKVKQIVVAPGLPFIVFNCVRACINRRICSLTLSFTQPFETVRVCMCVCACIYDNELNVIRRPWISALAAGYATIK